MDLHQASCTCRVCQKRQIVIEQHFGQRNKRYPNPGYHHGLVMDAWRSKISQMVQTTFRKCRTILLEHSPNFKNSKWNEQRYGQLRPFTDEVLKEMTESPKKEAYMGPTWQSPQKQPRYIFGENSIESLLELYTFHKNLENELILICEQASPLEVKVKSIEIKIQQVSKTLYKRVEANRIRTRLYDTWTGAPWYIYREQFEHPFQDLFREINAEIERLDVIEREKTILRFMKIGPDMPEYLAEAMADELISQQEAAEIFRNGWHRNDVSSKVLAAFLRSKTPVKNSNQETLSLDFQTAQWLHSHHEHNSLILAIINSEMKIETARELLNSDFHKFPDATNAIVAGNPVETVAMMYGIILQPSESSEASLPISPPHEVNEDNPSFPTNKEWSREFDDWG